MVDLNKFDDSLVKKILTTGATIRDAGKIVGNQSYLSQTNNKKTFGIEDFDSVGRQVQGKQRIYFIKNANFNEIVMKTFNQRLAQEVTSFYLLGYTLKNIEYVEGHQIANLTFVVKKENETEEITISFVDVTETRFIVSQIEDDAPKYRNIFVLPNVYGDSTKEGDMEMLLMETQQVLLSQSIDDLVVITTSVLNKKKFYETNVLGDIHHSLSFVKNGGTFNRALFRDDMEQANNLTNYGIMKENKEFQLDQNGFYIDNGRIVELNNDATNSGVIIKGEGSEEYVGTLLDNLDSYYPVAMRYYDKRYQPEEDASVDDTLDDIAKEMTGANSFIEFEADYLTQYIKDKAEELDDEDEGIPASSDADETETAGATEYADIFNKTEH